ncbi:MAG: hypothetical protein ACE5EL_02870, partial [Anaerolineae bacterium]
MMPHLSPSRRHPPRAILSAAVALALAWASLALAGAASAAAGPAPGADPGPGARLTAAELGKVQVDASRITGT